MLFNRIPVSATWVSVTSLSAPKLNTAASEINRKSSPTDKSAATPAPPPTVNAPVVELLEAVVAVTATTPPELIVIACHYALPMLPASGITILPPVVSNPATSNCTIKYCSTCFTTIKS